MNGLPCTCRRGQYTQPVRSRPTWYGDGMLMYGEGQAHVVWGWDAYVWGGAGPSGMGRGRPMWYEEGQAHVVWGGDAYVWGGTGPRGMGRGCLCMGRSRPEWYGEGQAHVV